MSRGFTTTTPAGLEVHITGDPNMPQATLAALTEMFDLAYAQYSQATSCEICGCTDDRACPGGCSWANEQHTLCSRCAPTAVAVAWQLTKERKSS